MDAAASFIVAKIWRRLLFAVLHFRIQQVSGLNLGSRALFVLLLIKERFCLISMPSTSSISDRESSSIMAASRAGRGALIVFEGVDRCGKSTQTKILAEALPSARLMRFPDRTTATGKIVDSYLRNGVELDDKAVHLLFSANRWEAARGMRESLMAGTSLVVDRYSYSGVCFTGAKEGQDIEWCKQPERGLPEPDVIIYLELPIEKAMERGAFGEERYEKEDMQRKVKENFESLMTPQWKVLDASQSIEALSRQIREIADATIESCANTPIGDLWKWESKE